MFVGIIIWCGLFLYSFRFFRFFFLFSFVWLIVYNYISLFSKYLGKGKSDVKIGNVEVDVVVNNE